MFDQRGVDNISGVRCRCRFLGRQHTADISETEEFDGDNVTNVYLLAFESYPCVDVADEVERDQCEATP
jgi:hypothetical protein